MSRDPSPEPTAPPPALVQAIERLVTESRAALASAAPPIATLELRIDLATGAVDLALSALDDAAAPSLPLHPEPAFDRSTLDRALAERFAARDFEQAHALLREAIAGADDPWDAENLTAMLQELEHYRRATAEVSLALPAAGVETLLGSVRARPAIEHFERFWGSPQALFVADLDGHRVLGRKHLASRFLDGTQRLPHGERVRSSMLLGVSKREQISEEGVHLYFHPFEPEEREEIFARLARSGAELSFPYPYLDRQARLEKRALPSGWELTPELVVELDRGEDMIRRYTVQRLEAIAAEDGVDLEQATFYDPACSTGTFLQAIKRRYPRSKTIGQDLSLEMVEYARAYVDVVHHGDAIDSPLPLESADVAFLRFLNAEVVTTPDARRLLPRLVERVKPGGYLIAFGFTPVLLGSDEFRAAGLDVRQSLAVSEDRGEISQFYLLRRRASMP